MTKKSTSSGDSQKEFLLNLHRKQMQEIEEENPEGYRNDLLWKASKELLMQHDPETPSHMEKSEQKGSQYDVYLPMMQKNEWPKETEDGSFEKHYKNGEIFSKGTYLNGKLNGEYFRFFENGQLMNRMTYTNGISDGPYEWFYENGQLREKGTFKNGKGRDGVVEMYYQTGQLRFRRVYDMGKRIR